MGPTGLDAGPLLTMTEFSCWMAPFDATENEKMWFPSVPKSVEPVAARASADCPLVEKGEPEIAVSAPFDPTEYALI
ncbi:MAG: hypothetical protein WBD46_05230 [Acidobacteriaceae bacterium]